jgi:hypothetical protein
LKFSAYGTALLAVTSVETATLAISFLLLEPLGTSWVVEEFAVIAGI